MEHIIYRIAKTDSADAVTGSTAQDNAYGAHETVPAGTPEAHGEVNVAQISQQMVVWTWVVFFVVALILYRVAWKPILAALADREEKIQRALDDARTARESVERIEATRDSLIAEADAKAKEILAEARHGAVEAARVIEEKAREQAQILLENAQREVRAAREQAESALRHEMATFAVALSSRLVQENLDTPKNQALVGKLIEEL